MSTKPEPRLLDVGDELVYRGGFSGTYFNVFEITRVTAQYAWAAEHTKYHRMMENGWFGDGLVARPVGGGYTRHELMTDALRAEIDEARRRNKALREFQDIEPLKLTTDQLEQIALIAKSTGK